MATDTEIIEKIRGLMNQPDRIRNIAICAHIDHGKTTFSDNLLAGAGMISQELAGKLLSLDFHWDEQLRGITIDAANVNMLHHVEGVDHLINLIDTPGHIDFSGEVTRAMRAVDGCIVLCDAVEGIMPQTETVLRQALRERVKPTLFINKVDRLIREVKLTPEKMQERFIEIISSVNEFIKQIAPNEFKDKWYVSVQDGSVCFGSAFHRWAVSSPYMKKKNISFKDIITYYNEGERYKELPKLCPLSSVVLDLVVKHLPNPVTAQKYRIPHIWKGDIESPEGKSLIGTDPNGPVAFICTKIVIDPHAGEVAAGRLFSGTVKQGQEVHMIGAKRMVRVQQVNIYKGKDRLQVDGAVAGNIIGLVGLKGVFAGETVSTKQDLEPFEALKHIFEPVVTKSIEAAKASDLARLVEVLKQVGKEDPTVKVEINEETGENLISGMGELHLEILEGRIKADKGLDVKTSPPIVVYREAVTKKSVEVEGKSPNKHNKFYMIVEPLPENIYESMKSGDIPEGKVKKGVQALYDAMERLGIPAKEAKKIRYVLNGNMLIDDTRGIVHIGEVQELVNEAFEQVMKEGPLAREPGVKILVRIMDCKLHEDAIHRGPAQVVPAVREAIREAMVQGGALLYEPQQIIQIEAPSSFMGDLTRLIQNKRGQLIDIEQEGEHMTLKCKLPVAEMLGFAGDLRSVTSGRGSYSLVDQMFEKLPTELQNKVITNIRQRKGLKIEGSE